MKGALFLLLLNGILWTAIGCGGDTARLIEKATETDLDTPVLFWGSCENRSSLFDDSKLCREWYGDFFVNLNLQLACEKNHDGQFNATEYCDKSEDKLLGTCVVEWPEESEVRFYYYADDWSKEDAEDHCRFQKRKAKWIANFHKDKD